MTNQKLHLPAMKCLCLQAPVSQNDFSQLFGVYSSIIVKHLDKRPHELINNNIQANVVLEASPTVRTWCARQRRKPRCLVLWQKTINVLEALWPLRRGPKPFRQRRKDTRDLNIRELHFLPTGLYLVCFILYKNSRHSCNMNATDMIYWLYNERLCAVLPSSMKTSVKDKVTLYKYFLFCYNFCF